MSGEFCVNFLDSADKREVCGSRAEYTAACRYESCREGGEARRAAAAASYTINDRNQTLQRDPKSRRGDNQLHGRKEGARGTTHRSPQSTKDVWYPETLHDNVCKPCNRPARRPLLEGVGNQPRRRKLFTIGPRGMAKTKIRTPLIDGPKIRPKIKTDAVSDSVRPPSPPPPPHPPAGHTGPLRMTRSATRHPLRSPPVCKVGGYLRAPREKVDLK